MRKHNEGYSMVLVLVVLVVMCLVAAFLLSFSLSNLQNQQASVERMEDRYAAAGEIEKLVAQLEALIDTTVEQKSVTLENADVSCEDKTVTYEAVSDSVHIEVTLRLIADSMEETGAENEYKLTNWTGVEYVSYIISTASEEVAEE